MSGTTATLPAPVWESQVQAVAVNASATTSSASSSSSSLIDRGGRKRKTLPQVPQVSTTTPFLWQYAATAPARAASGSRVPVLTS